MKDASDKFIKKNVKGMERHDKEAKMNRTMAKKRSMTPNTDELINAYPSSHAAAAASPKVVSKDQDLALDVNPKKK